MRGSPSRLLALLLVALAALLAPPHCARAEDEPEPARVEVPATRIWVDDGDSLSIRWDDRVEQVRLLGMDTPEIQHLDHDIPYTQPFGEQALGFLQGCLATADRVELLRASAQDPYGRTLGYLYVDGRNYSVLVVSARLAVESVSHFGDNGLPGPAAEVLEAAKAAGPVAFEPPHEYRSRMRRLSRWMKQRGTYPVAPPAEKAPAPR
jgi:endonuclease YncB( thermonuclease family)